MPYGQSPSIYFLKTTNTWRHEDDDGAEMEFDAAKGIWVPVVRSLIAFADEED